MKHLNIEISSELLRLLKIKAIEQGVTLRDFVVSCLESATGKEKNYEN